MSHSKHDSRFKPTPKLLALHNHIFVIAPYDSIQSRHANVMQLAYSSVPTYFLTLKIVSYENLFKY